MKTYKQLLILNNYQGASLRQPLLPFPTLIVSTILIAFYKVNGNWRRVAMSGGPLSLPCFTTLRLHE